MRVLIFHGYMLRGTGSNIYNASLAPALARLGHEVHLLCQDREVRIEGVEIHNPDIGGLLPVYVKDPYEGFEVKAFPELSEEELDRYLDANVAAVRAVAERGRRDRRWPSPTTSSWARRSSPAPTSGPSPPRSTARPSSTRSNRTSTASCPYAEEGMNAASGVLVGSRHTAESLWAALPESRARGEDPPRTAGVDIETFRPRAAAMGGRGRARPAAPPTSAARPGSSSSAS